MGRVFPQTVPSAVNLPKIPPFSPITYSIASQAQYKLTIFLKGIRDRFAKTILALSSYLSLQCGQWASLQASLSQRLRHQIQIKR